MSIAFNQGPAGVPLARILASFFAARSRVSRDVGVRGRTTHANTAMMSTNLLPGVLWRADDGLELDITSVQNTKVKLMRFSASLQSQPPTGVTKHWRPDVVLPFFRDMEFHVLQSFHKRRTRDEEGKTLVEGHRLVCDLIEGGHTPSLVIVSREALRASPGPRLQTALETLDANIVSVATAEVVQRCSDTVSSQGIVALIDRPMLPLPTTLRMVLICDGIQDPGNLGTLIRTAKGLGVDGVILTGACVDYWSPKAVRSSMGASFRLPALVVESWGDVVGLMRSHGVRMHAAEGDASLSYFDADWTFPSALVVGAEARGLSDDARRGLERGEIVGVSVPLDGGVESLNAAVAGAIVLGEAQRQRAMAERGFILAGETEESATRDGLSTNAQ